MSFKYQIIKRPRRRTVSISVKPDCSVRLLVPANLPEKKIIELIKQKSSWVEGKIAYFQELQKRHKQKKYVSGECFKYLGRSYRLKIVHNDENKDVKLLNGTFNIPVPSGLQQGEQTLLIIRRLSTWYQNHALTRLEEKVRRYSAEVGIYPTSVGVKGYKSRWGTCHLDGRIYFNWRIIIAPHSVVDYLVVHELCHLVHHNHSKRYWKQVETILPDYSEREEWLKLNGRELTI